MSTIRNMIDDRVGNYLIGAHETIQWDFDKIIDYFKKKDHK